MTIDEERDAVAVEAYTWKGTPFENGQHCKGAGVDCAWLIAACYNAAIGTFLTVRPYPYQWFLHKNKERIQPEGCNYKTDDWYIEDLLAAGFVEVLSPKKGDVILSKMGLAYCHGGIVLDWPQVIHAEARSNKVISADGIFDYFYFAGRKVKFFTWKGWLEDI